MRKTLLLLLLLSSANLFANETDDKSWIRKMETLDNGAIRIFIDGTKVDDGLREEGTAKDWIAVYPKNASNAWKNVLDWRWADFTPYLRGNRDHVYSGATRIEKPGEYQVRFFRNNSYKLFKAFDFTITKKRDSFVTYLFGDYANMTHPQVVIHGFKRNTAVPAPKDWIGIYKKDDDNSWSNVIEWTWVKDTTFDGNDRYRVMPLDPKKYSADERYEARYFLNNSFKTHMKSDPFYVPKLNKLNIQEVNAYYQNGRLEFSVWVDGKEFKHGSEDWVGLYKKGDSNDWSNVLTWGWAKDFTEKKLIRNIHLKKGEYEVRYFKNNSFITYMQRPLTVYK